MENKDVTDMSKEGDAKNQEAKEKRLREDMASLQDLDPVPSSDFDYLVEGFIVSESGSSSSVDSEELNSLRRGLEKIRVQDQFRMKYFDCKKEKPVTKIGKEDCYVQINDEMYVCKKSTLKEHCQIFEEDIPETLDLSYLNISQDSFIDTYEWMCGIENRQNIVREDSIVELYFTSVMLKINSLKEKIFIKLNEKQYEEDIVVKWMTEVSEKGYYEKVKDFFDLILSKLNFYSFIMSEKYLSLDVELLEKLFSSDSLAVKNEIDVFYPVIYWLLYNWEERKEFSSRIIACVRLGLCTPIQIILLKKEKEIACVLSEAGIAKILDDSLAFSVFYRSCNDDIDKLQNFCEERMIPIFTPRVHKATKSSYDSYVAFLETVQKDAKN